MDSTLIVLVLVAVVPFVLVVAADLAVERVVLAGRRNHRLVWITLENLICVVAFFTFLTIAFNNGARGLIGVWVIALPKLIVSAAFLIAARSSELTGTMRAALCPIFKYLSFVGVFAALLWVASID